MTARPELNAGTGSVQSQTAPDAGLEPLLWLQLLGIGAIVGEALALLVLLGSVDPGPLPGLERLLIWALGALGPAVLLSKRPADPWSLLVLQAPSRGRREIQRRLMRLQDQPVLRLLPLLAGSLLLPAIWRIDQLSGLASGLSPLADSNRLAVLLLSVPVLAVIVWHVQQIGQALWLLSRPAEAINTAEPLSINELEQTRLSLGLPLLLLSPLRANPTIARAAVQRASEPEAVVPTPAPERGDISAAGQAPGSEAKTENGSESGNGPLSEGEDEAEPNAVIVQGATDQPLDEDAAPGLPLPASEQAAPEEPSQAPTAGGQSGEAPSSAAGAIEPEQAAEDGEGGDLDQQIAGHEP